MFVVCDINGLLLAGWYYLDWCDFES